MTTGVAARWRTLQSGTTSDGASGTRTRRLNAIPPAIRVAREGSPSNVGERLSVSCTRCLPFRFIVQMRCREGPNLTCSKAIFLAFL